MYEQDRFLVRLQQRVLAEQAILTCFLSGSYGRGLQDRYSDLDVALVFADEEAKIDAYENRREFVRSVTPYVPVKSFDALHIRPYFHIAVYSNGTKVDFRYENRDSLEPGIHDRSIRLLKDTDGWAAEFQRRASSLPAVTLVPTITIEELTVLDERFWVMLFDIFRLLARGDYDKPFSIYLEMLYFTLPRLLELLAEENPARKGLIKATYSSDVKATTSSIRDLFEAYLAARSEIVKQHRLDFNADRSFEIAMGRIIRGTG